MKTIKSILLAATLLTGGLIGITSCTDYQDEIDALDKRVYRLENLVDTINKNIDAMKVIVNALESADYITNVREIDGGYILNFYKNGPIQIFDGKDGRDGNDAQTPTIEVAQDPIDKQWYWKVNGDWLTIDGQRIRANGHDGKDAVSPQVRINPETGMWEISADGNDPWVPTGTSAKPIDGVDGLPGNPFFKSVEYVITTENGTKVEYMKIVTTSGQTFMIPIVRN